MATVKNGVVSAKKPGKCTITAKYAKKKYKCKVKVKQNGTAIMNENNTTNSESVSTVDNFSNLIMEAQLTSSDKNTLTLKINLNYS